jgi:hypothetical protein
MIFLRPNFQTRILDSAPVQLAVVVAVLLIIIITTIEEYLLPRGHNILVVRLLQANSNKHKRICIALPKRLSTHSFQLPVDISILLLSA